MNIMSAGEGLLEELRSEFEAIQLRLRENQGLIEQSSAEVKKWEEEAGRANYHLRQVHDNFETWPRADIRSAYDNVLEARTRLLTMRSQFEKLQDNQNQLKHYGDLLRSILDELDTPEFSMSAGPVTATQRAPSLSAAGETVIRIVNAQEGERQSLAKSLHDGPAQSLTNFILQAEVCQRLFDRDPDRAMVELGNLKTAASASFQKVRDFIFDLRPMMLDDLGLIPTLRRYTENMVQKHTVRLDFKFTGEEKRRVAKHTEVMMFRSIQTMLQVSREYLAAQNIKMQVDMGHEAITARIEDDGNGFDPEVDLDPRQGDSNVQVLNALRDRIELVGGTVDVYSAVGEGSRFQVVLPIYEENEVDY